MAKTAAEIKRRRRQETDEFNALAAKKFSQNEKWRAGVSVPFAVGQECVRVTWPGIAEAPRLLSGRYLGKVLISDLRLSPVELWQIEHEWFWYHTAYWTVSACCTSLCFETPTGQRNFAPIPPPITELGYADHYWDGDPTWGVFPWQRTVEDAVVAAIQFIRIKGKPLQNLLRLYRSHLLRMN